MRQLLAKFLIGVVLLTGLLPMMPHDDFGDAALAHGIAATDSGLTASSDDGSGEHDGHSNVHCNGTAHLFVTTVLPSFAALRCEGKLASRHIEFPASRIFGPSPPPPNV